MAERWLEIEVSRREYSTVYVRVDDLDPRYRKAFDGEKLTPYAMAALMDEAQTAAATTLRSDEWDRDPLEDSVDVEAVKLTTAKTARAYRWHDAVDPARGLRDEDRARPSEGQLALLEE
jgi:hypothetical protein